MTATAVIPVKRLANVKRRLTSRLGRRERAALVLRLLERELDVLNTVASIERTIVVTSDEQVKRLAEMKSATVALQSDNGVNAAIQRGIDEAFLSGADTVVALHCDLPFVCRSDIEALVEASERGTFVIAPDRKRVGTNAIVVRRPAPVELKFGTESYSRHLAAAQSAGQLIREVLRCGLAFDLDTPDDLLEYRKRRRRFRA